MEDDKKQNKSYQADGYSLAIGLSLGTMMGLATDNLALWLGIGLVYGLITPYFKRRINNDGDEA